MQGSFKDLKIIEHNNLYEIDRESTYASCKIPNSITLYFAVLFFTPLHLLKILLFFQVLEKIGTNAEEKPKDYRGRQFP